MAARTVLRRFSTRAASPLDVCIVSAVRTPIGGFNGSLASLSAPALGAAAIKGALAKANVNPSAVQQCWMGNVLSAGIGQAPARQAARQAGLPDSTQCTTINKVCSSGMKAIVLGAQQIQLGLADVVVAGGFESMSNVPYIVPKARFGARMGDAKMVDAMVADGLWDPYGDCHMGGYAELCAEKHSITRADQDAHADESYRRARAATKAGLFAAEVVPVSLPGKKKGTSVEVTLDDEPATPERPANEARAAFKKENGTVTAANASTISDGAACVLLMSRAAAERHGCKVLAVIKGYGDAEQEPAWFTTAPAKALPAAVAHAGVTLDQVDFFEINEAFSVVSVANNRLLCLDPNKVNVHGGAVALGHPIGASGARIVVTLLHVLQQKGGKIGAAGSTCSNVSNLRRPFGSTPAHPHSEPIGVHERSLQWWRRRERDRPRTCVSLERATSARATRCVSSLTQRPGCVALIVCRPSSGRLLQRDANTTHALRTYTCGSWCGRCARYRRRPCRHILPANRCVRVRSRI